MMISVFDRVENTVGIGGNTGYQLFSSISHTKLVLTHYQTTNFRLFQTERTCRRQFQV